MIPDRPSRLTFRALTHTPDRQRSTALLVQLTTPIMMSIDTFVPVNKCTAHNDAYVSESCIAKCNCQVTVNI